MTAFIVPGDIMRQTQATMRHRGVDMGGAAFRRTESLIVGGGECFLGTQASGFTVVYRPETGVAEVAAPQIDLTYEFTAEES